MLLSPCFHVDHAYKPLCPTLKRLCGQLQGKSSREFCSAVVRSTSHRLFGETSKHSVYSARTHPTSASAMYVCRQTMALPFLPADIIADEFQTLHTASDDAQVAQHLQYMERQWISSTTWPPTTWSDFRQPVQTNNDVEAWR